MRKPSPVRYSFKWFLMISALVLMLMAISAGWLMAKPRNMTAFSRTLIERLQPLGSPLEVEVGAVELVWETWRKPVRLGIDDILIRSAAYDTHYAIPSGEIELSLLPLLWGEVRIKHLRLSGLQGGLHIGAENWFIVNQQGELFYRYTMPDSAEDEPLVFPVDKLTLESSGFILKHIAQSLQARLVETRITLRQGEEASQLEMAFETTAQLADHRGVLSGGGRYNMTSNHGAFELSFQDVNPEWLCATIVDCNGLPLLAMELAGQANLLIEDGEIGDVTLQLKGEKGTLSHQPWLPDVIALDELLLDMQGNVDSASAKLNRLALKMQTGTRITASGTASYEDEQLYIKARADSSMMPVNHLSRYWPAGLAPATRHWATTRIREGMATKAWAEIDIEPEDLEAEYLPDDFLSTAIHLEDTSVNYIEGFPKAEKVNGIVRFTGTTMTAEIASASAMSATRLDGSHLVMSDLNAPGTPMTADLVLATHPADVAQIITLINGKLLAKAGVGLRRARGEINAKAQLGFNAFSESEQASEAINWDALRYDLSAEFRDISGVRYNAQPLPAPMVGNVQLNNDKMQAKLRVQSDAQDFSFHYRSGEQAPHYRLSGKKFDLSAFAGNEDDDGMMSLSELPPFHLDLDLKRLYFADAAATVNVHGQINCPGRCESAFVKGDFEPEGGFQFAIEKDNEGRKLSLVTDDLGSLMQLFDAKATLRGGKGELKGVFDDRVDASQLNGRIIVTDFFIVKAPILGRVLNAASLTSIVDILNGKGIRLNKAASDFSFANDLLRLKNGKAAGPAIGVLVEGDINLETSRIDLQGNLAPAYGLNSLVGKVPLVGKALVGGKGESVIAMNYSAKGDMDDPQVLVNPLSALTPGFTRRFFDVFDMPADTTAPGAETKPKTSSEAQPTGDEPIQWQIINP